MQFCWKLKKKQIILCMFGWPPNQPQYSVHGTDQSFSAWPVHKNLCVECALINEVITPTDQCIGYFHGVVSFKLTNQIAPFVTHLPFTSGHVASTNYYCLISFVYFSQLLAVHFVINVLWTLKSSNVFVFSCLFIVW